MIFRFGKANIRNADIGDNGLPTRNMVAQYGGGELTIIQ
jgi:hypothetical protein